MKVNVKGTVLEKFTREGKNSEGAKFERMFVRLFQSGERVNLDVNVNASTFSELQVGEIVELEDISINVYKDNLYARQ